MVKIKHSWLYDEKKGLKEKILFKDRIEYRISGKLSNPIGPALVWLETKEGELPDPEYYFNGNKMEQEVWNKEVFRFWKIKRLKKLITNN